VATRRPSPPPGLGLAGRTLWRAIVGGYELNPAEVVILGEASRVADRLTALATALADAPLTVLGSTGQPVVNPLLGEARAQQRVLDQLLRALALPLPTERVGRRRSPSARENAVARWSGENGGA
jgi:hypothetical protein